MHANLLHKQQWQWCNIKNTYILQQSMFSKIYFVKKGKFFVGTIFCNISQTKTGFLCLKQIMNIKSTLSLIFSTNCTQLTNVK